MFPCDQYVERERVASRIGRAFDGEHNCNVAYQASMLTIQYLDLNPLGGVLRKFTADEIAEIVKPPKLEDAITITARREQEPEGNINMLTDKDFKAQAREAMASRALELAQGEVNLVTRLEAAEKYYAFMQSKAEEIKS